VAAATKPVLIMVLLWIILAGAWGGQTVASDLATLLPVADDLNDWAPTGQAQQYVGLDLYQLINGGAELYHEYGFSSVLAQEYGDQAQRYIALEIYEMESPASAFGIYSFKTGQKGQSIPVGNEAILAGYYLNIWKGRFLLTLSGVDADEATRKGLVEIGNAVADRITAAKARPELTHLLPVEPSAPVKVWYMVGDLALANLAPFNGIFPLGFSEGTAADYGGFFLFLLAYGSPELASPRLAPAVDRLTSEGFSPLDSTMTDIPHGIRFADEKGRTVHLELQQRFILVTVGAEDAECEMIRESLRNRLASVADD